MTVFVPAVFCEKSQDYKTEREIELEKKLDIAVKALEKLQRRNCIDCKCGENCPLREYSKKGKGCGTCVEGLAQEALAKIKEIK